MALTELSRYLPRDGVHNRFLRAGMRTPHRREGSIEPSNSPQDEAAAPSARTVKP
jgi:putative (di)nucleoside polyphosphate hydrolase